MNVLVLGYGLLGKELVNQTGWDYRCRENLGWDSQPIPFDITDISTFTDTILEWFGTPHSGIVGYIKPTVLINCVANTNTYSTDKKSHIDVNYNGVVNLVEFCNKHEIKLVQISTDYVYANSTGTPTEDDVPVHAENWYSYSKLLADGYIELKSNDYLILRGGHKKIPYPHPNVGLQIGNFDYVDVISKIIINLVNQEKSGIFNIGTDTKTLLSLAKQTNINVNSKSLPNNIPTDVSMDITKLKNI